MDNLNIFDILYPKYKISKPIRLIELFGGYGSQYFALKYLNADVEHWKLCEWAVKSIQAYKDAHCYNDNNDYSKDISKDELINYLYNKGISQNYNEPMNLQQIKKQTEKWIRNVYNNIIATKNLVNIQQVKGNDLEIVNTNKYNYIMTYSFPCQDLSLAGKRLGMNDTSTRSGMLWEVERILLECKNINTLPQILLMENVPQVHGEDNIDDFQKWQLSLEKMGYKNYIQDLIATDYEIPQTRNRCFMISILGDYSYTFPQSIPLKLKLKDMLEDNVDEKYYLTQKQLEQIANWNAYQNPFDTIGKENCPNITTRSGAFAAGMILTKENILVPEATKKGYALATDGDGVYINRPQQKRGVVQKGKIQTLKTSCDDVGVVINYGIATNESQEWQKKPLEEKSRTILANKSNGGVGVIENNLRIRKLTPKECFRLMGVKDEDYERIAKNQSDNSLYHLAGDSLVTTIMMALLSQMLDINWQEYFNTKEWWRNE